MPLIFHTIKLQCLFSESGGFPLLGPETTVFTFIFMNWDIERCIRSMDQVADLYFGVANVIVSRSLMTLCIFCSIRFHLGNAYEFLNFFHLNIIHSTLAPSCRRTSCSISQPH
ncbi:hypothetical protein AYI70_g1958 [Smittium culicis]|uniref:Uncharacterized protein n=1 Tax=Smittium culicis TaxID=133412 RepID=A0A1R1YAH9_9FUNG|nr:hypothetical protein AYI70_g1958 [Smittium culicis]